MSLAEKKLNLLVAYPYMSKQVIQQIKENKDVIRFVLDSGAFTAWKSGKPVALDDYCRFLDSLPFEPWRYFTLDVIGDPHASMKNYETMLKRGYKPVPIFTRGEDLSVLDDYYKTSDVVGIGGLVGTPGNKGFINGIMRHVAGRKVHWLGFTSNNYVKQYKPYMCDSSSWESGARYATVNLYLGNGKFKIIKKTDFQTKPSPTVVTAIEKLGFSVGALAKAESWVGGPSVSRNLCAASGVQYSSDVEKNLKTKLFLAAAASEGIGMLIKYARKNT